jgi:hypothetical protein
LVFFAEGFLFLGINKDGLEGLLGDQGGHERGGDGLALLAAGAVLAVLTPLSYAKRRLGRRMASRALRGDGTLSGIGAATSLLGLAALLLSRTLGWWWADRAAALIVKAIAAAEAWRTLPHQRSRAIRIHVWAWPLALLLPLARSPQWVVLRCRWPGNARDDVPCDEPGLAGAGSGPASRPAADSAVKPGSGRHRLTPQLPPPCSSASGACPTTPNNG